MATSRKLFKQLEQRYQDDLQAVQQALGGGGANQEADASKEDADAEEAEPGMDGGPFGSLRDAHNRKLFFYMISTLNAAFPDFDFR